MLTRRRTATLALSALLLVAAGSLTSCTPQLRAVEAARDQIGVRYASGGESPSSGFDCSGLTQWAWGQAGVDLPRTSRDQWAWVTRITKAQLQPGDLIFYSSSGPKGTVSHVALYAGDDTIIHARKAGYPVEEQPVSFWASNIVGYGRIPASALK